MMMSHAIPIMSVSAKPLTGRSPRRNSTIAETNVTRSASTLVPMA